jgi:hypothetical protein
MPAMDREALLLLAALLAIPLLFFTGVIRLQTTPETITLWSGADIRCDDLEAVFWLWRMPQTARLTIDTDPSAPYPPFYYGGIAQVYVNDVLVKSYDPPLLDRDTLDVVQHLRTGFNKVKAVPKVAAILCNIQTQGLLSGFIELTYPPDGDGGGGGGGGGNTPDQNTLILVAGVGLIAAAFIIFWRSSRRG